MEVLAFQERLTLCWIPVPLRDAAVGEFPALLTKEMVPDEGPTPGGLKVTVKDTLFPAETVTGKAMPLSE